MLFKKKYYILSISLFILSSLLRLYKIAEHTIFLGDQGRTGITIYNAFITKTIPLAGPPVLTGQHLGPFFYYLLAPVLILFKFNPVGMAIFICLLDTLSALLFFYIGQELFGLTLGFLIALLYTASSYLVTASRQIWEPTLIPFFATLLLFSFLKIYKQKKFAYTILTYICLGILLQLHYPDILLFFPTAIFFLWMLLREESAKRISLIIWTFPGIAAFSLTVFPFIIYEKMHQFSDIKDIIYSFLFPSVASQNSPSFYINATDLIFRLFKYVIPVDNLYIINLLAIFVIFVPLVHKRNIWHIILVIWFFTGIIFLSLYRGTIFNHYLNFLVPVPFLLFGSFLNNIKTSSTKTPILGSLLILIAFHIYNTDVFSKGPNDIPRIEAVTNGIMKLAKKRKFSFTVFSSDSFSDLHYRYFFYLKQNFPQPITRTDYPFLFIICEKGPCPSFTEMRKLNSITAMCSSDHCEGNYPNIDLHYWRLSTLKIIYNSSIFLYERI